jgi:hypothetical protein
MGRCFHLKHAVQKDKVTGNDVKFVWGAEEQADFDFLTTGLADAIELEYPDWSQPFSLRTLTRARKASLR